MSNDYQSDNSYSCKIQNKSPDTILSSKHPQLPLFWVVKIPPLMVIQKQRVTFRRRFTSRATMFLGVCYLLLNTRLTKEQSADTQCGIMGG